MSSAALALAPPPRAHLEAIGRGYQPDPRMDPADWAEAHYWLPSVGSGKRGRWLGARTPFARGVLSALAPHAPWERVTVCFSAQIVKTEIALILIGFTVDQAPNTVMFAQSTLGSIRRTSMRRVAGMIAASPRLREKFARAGKRSSILVKNFPNGQLVMVGANSPDDFRSTPAPILILDELDAYAADLHGEGTPMEIAEARTLAFARGKILVMSTPTIRGLSPIERDCEAADVEYQWQMPCPHCGTVQPFVFEQLRIPPGNAGAASFACVGCPTPITNRDKAGMVKAGQWVAIRDNGQRNHVAFRGIWRAHALFGKVSLAGIARKYESVRNHPGKLRSFENLWLGRSHAGAAEAPDWRRLYDRREDYAPGTIPRGGLFLVAGADVQVDRIELEVVAFARDLESWSIAYHVLAGDTEQQAVWTQLDALLARTWPHADGGELPLRVLALDARYRPDPAYRWARRHPQPSMAHGFAAARKARTAAVIHGVSKDGAGTRLVSNPTHADTGKAKKYGLKSWPVAKLMSLSLLYDWLALERPTDGDLAAGRGYPAGFCHFPTAYDDDFFKQLTSQTIVMSTNKYGYPERRMQRDASVRCEVGDCRRYAMAAAYLFGADRFKKKDWRDLERALYGDTPVPLRQGPIAAAPVAAEAPAIPAPTVAAPLVAPAPTAKPLPRSGPRFRSVVSPWMRR